MMAADVESTNPAEHDWHYTRESLQESYDKAFAAVKEGEASKDDGLLAAAMGYALDLITIAEDIPESPRALKLVPPTNQEDMMVALVFAGILFQEEGPNAVRMKLAKMLASYEFFTTMNTLMACEVEAEQHVDESGLSILARTPGGEELKFDFLGRAKFTMSRCFFPDPGEEPNVGITVHPFYKKLRDDFVLPLLASYDPESDGGESSLESCKQTVEAEKVMRII